MNNWTTKHTVIAVTALGALAAVWFFSTSASAASSPPSGGGGGGGQQPPPPPEPPVPPGPGGISGGDDGKGPPIVQFPRPPGDPPGGCVFNPTLFPTKASVKDAFASMGYEVPDRETMNDLGPDGALGGGDDVSSPVVKQFQRDYNRMSFLGKLTSPMGGSAGGLDPDGFVGSCVLSAIQNIMAHMPLEDWQSFLQG